MSILITGASGAFGAWFARAKWLQGEEIISIEHDTHPISTAKLLGIDEKITWVRGSILDATLCKRVIADYGVDHVYHFAALPLVQVGTRTTTPIFETNLMGTVNLLEAVKENAWAGKKIQFVMTSTDKVYGDAGDAPYTEDMPLNGLGIYECSKAAADLAVRTYVNCGFIPSAVVVRPCNMIMPGDLNLGRVFTRTIIPCLRGAPPVLYRTQYLREFMYVQDGISGIEAAVKAGKKNKLIVMNIGSGERRTLEECVGEIMSHFPGIEPQWIEPPAIARVEIPFQRLDTSRIRATGWEPRYKFPETVFELVKWWQDLSGSLPPYIRNWTATDWHG